MGKNENTKYLDEGLIVFRTWPGETLEEAHVTFSPSIGQDSNTVEVIGLELMDWTLPRWCFPCVPFAPEESQEAEFVDVCLLVGLHGHPTLDEVELVCPLSRGSVFPSREKLVSVLSKAFQDALGSDLALFLSVSVGLTDREELEIAIQLVQGTENSDSTRLSFARLYLLPHLTSTVASDEECVVRRLMGFRDPSSLYTQGPEGEPQATSLRLMGSSAVDVTPITFMDVFLPSNVWRTSENGASSAESSAVASVSGRLPFERITLREPLVHFGKLGAVSFDIMKVDDRVSVYEQELHSVAGLSKRNEDRFSPSAVHHRIRLFENPLPLRVFSRAFRRGLRMDLDCHGAFGNAFDVLRNPDGTAFPMQLVFRVLTKGAVGKRFRKQFIEI